MRALALGERRDQRGDRLVELVLLLQHGAGVPLREEVVERLAREDDQRADARTRRDRLRLLDELATPELGEAGGELVGSTPPGRGELALTLAHGGAQRRQRGGRCDRLRIRLPDRFRRSLVHRSRVYGRRSRAPDRIAPPIPERAFPPAPHRSEPAIAPDRPTVAVDLRAAVREPTGIGVYTLSLLRELARQRDWRLVGLAHREPLAAGELRSWGIDVEWQPAPLGVIWQQRHLPRRLAAGDVDLFWSPLLTLPRRRLAIPAVITLHDLTVLHHPETLPVKVRWSLAPFLEASVEAASRIVVASRSTADDVAASFPDSREKLRVIQHGVDEEFVPLAEGGIRSERERLGVQGGFFLFVGSLEPRKNVGLLLDAWETLRAERPEAALPLLLAGPPGWKNRELQARIEALRPQGVRHLGRLERGALARLVASATALVYPSLYEGFGLPVAEAMACGVPVVVSDRSCLPELAGDAGLTVDADDAASLAAALESLATDPERARQLGRRGLERARALTWERAASGLSAVFREALDGGRGARP